MMAEATIEVLHGRVTSDGPAAERLLDRGLPPNDRAQAAGASRGLRTRWLARAAQRVLLGERLGLAPGPLRFDIGQEGKPELAGEAAGRLHFNLSHTDERWALAVSGETPVGIDLELRERRERTEAIARRWFSPSHADRVADRPEDFLAIWTLYEAFGKALGRGLSGGLQGLWFEDGPPWPAPVELRELGDTGLGWFWQPLGVAGCAGAVVGRGRFRLAVTEMSLDELVG